MTNRSRYDALMHFVCADLGYCGSSKSGELQHVDDYLPTSGIVTADQFADWVFIADNEDPRSSETKLTKIREQIISAFIRHMGSDRVDVAELQWSGLK